MEKILEYLRKPRGTLDLINILTTMFLIIFFGLNISVYLSIAVLVLFVYFIYEFKKQLLYKNYFAWILLILSFFPLGYSVYVIIF